MSFLSQRKKSFSASHFLYFNSEEAELIEEERLIVSFLIQKSTNTQRAYKKEIGQFIEFLAEKQIWTLKSCRTSHIAEYLNRRAHLKSSSIRRSLHAISSLLSFLVRSGFLSYNPAQALDSVKQEDMRAYRSLSREMIQKLFRLDRCFRDRSLVRFLYVTGLRRQEVTKIRFKHLRIENQLVFLTVIGKGQKIRTIPLNLDFYKEIIAPLMFDDEGNILDGESPVFRVKGSNIKALSADRIYDIVKSMLKEVGAPKEASPHWLRHSHGSHSASAGVNLRLIQKTLGHSSLATTQIYLDTNPNESSALELTRLK